MPASKALRSTSAAVFTAALLATGAPAVGATAAPTATAPAGTSISCSSSDSPVRAHRFRLPRSDWQVVTFSTKCTASRGRTTVQVIWRRGAGSRDSMARYLERTAASKPGFRLRDFDTNAPKFKSPKRQTRKYDYSYRTDNGRRRVVGFGDRYTLVRISAPASRWDSAKQVARKARTTMVRRLR